MAEPIDYFEQSLFSGRDFRFQMRFRKAALQSFYEPTLDGPALLQERRKWLGLTPEKSRLLAPAGEPLLRRAVADAFPPACRELLGWELAPIDLLDETAARLEPDFLLLRKTGGSGRQEVVGGAVCFPSAWALEEKLGQSLEFTHGPVPGLNETLGSQIDKFLEKIPPGISWERTNWGLSRSPELNQHPSRRLPRLDAEATAAEVFLRIEWQSLAALPPDGVLFGIRVHVFPLEVALARAAWRSGLRHDLETMPEALLRYKGLWNARERLLELVS